MGSEHTMIVTARSAFSQTVQRLVGNSVTKRSVAKRV